MTFLDVSSKEESSSSEVINIQTKSETALIPFQHSKKQPKSSLKEDVGSSGTSEEDTTPLKESDLYPEAVHGTFICEVEGER